MSIFQAPDEKMGITTASLASSVPAMPPTPRQSLLDAFQMPATGGNNDNGKSMEGLQESDAEKHKQEELGSTGLTPDEARRQSSGPSATNGDQDLPTDTAELLTRAAQRLLHSSR